VRQAVAILFLLSIPATALGGGWTGSLWGGFGFGRNVGQSDFVFPSAALGRAIGRSNAVAVTFSYLPYPDVDTGVGCLGEDCPTEAVLTARVLHFGAGLRVGGGGDAARAYGEIAPALYHGTWTRRIGYADPSLNVEDSMESWFVGFHLALMIPIRITRSASIELGARYLFSESVTSELVGLEGAEIEGLRDTQILAGLALRF